MKKTKIDFVFNQAMARLLKKCRENSHLSQVEIAQRIGFSPKSGKIYISLLENGKIKKPSLGLILRYLSSCGVAWSEFFKQLDAIDFKQRHAKMISQLPRPPEKRKVELDAIRYEIGIEFPSKEKEIIDFDRLQNQIRNKVLKLLAKHQIGERQIDSYQKFA